MTTLTDILLAGLFGISIMVILHLKGISQLLTELRNQEIETGKTLRQIEGRLRDKGESNG